MPTTAVDIRNYVSNMDKNVYTIFNLPEEVIAVIFAYVSRSSASFRENLAKLIADDELGVSSHETKMATTFSEKASKFHEKWVVGYGHSSVAEHAVAHIGIEKISRLASAELELANSFNSFTEYSQRYQRPKRGDFFVPIQLEENEDMKQAYLSLNDQAYTVYEQLREGLYSYLHSSTKRLDGESDRAFHLRIEKIAFEDARYVLTLATHTNLGMTGNGRALRDTLVALLSNPHPECIQLAKSMRTEIEQVIPTLLRHLKPSEYILKTREATKFPFVNSDAFTHHTGPHATLVSSPDYKAALQTLATSLTITQSNASREEAQKSVAQLSLHELEQVAEKALTHLRFFDNPLGELQHITYTISLCISEANWHQLLRHNRRAHFSYGLPTIQRGYTTPPNVLAAGLKELYSSFIQNAEKVHATITAFNPLVAQYAVTNAHHREILMTASLWELHHLINLRTSPEAQWDIRETFEQLHKELTEKHPILLKYAKRRV